MRNRKYIQESIIKIWKQSLHKLVHYYDRRRGKLITFFPKLFIFFIALNILCYWWAMVTAFPDDIVGRERMHYFLLQFPVGFLGALFDTLSFFVTVFIARKALKATSTGSYLAHLSVDIIIAIIATWWVLFVFSFSGWIISLILHNPESLTQRNEIYEERLVQAVQNPTETKNLKNIYFGIIMGISAMLPTFTHLSMSLHSIFKFIKRR